jgi:hypothetical protein
MLSVNDVVEAAMLAPSAPSATSLLLTPAETTVGAPLRLADMDAGNELTMSSAIWGSSVAA